jgi:hypothetical protein
LRDIVERLDACSPLTIPLAHEARDEIVRLRADLVKERAELHRWQEDFERLRAECDEAREQASKWFAATEKASGVQKAEVEEWHRSQVKLLNSTQMMISKSLEEERDRLREALKGLCLRKTI